MNGFALDPYENPNESICVVCGGHRVSCSYPPICDDPNCRFEYELDDGRECAAEELGGEVVGLTY